MTDCKLAPPLQHNDALVITLGPKLKADKEDQGGNWPINHLVWLVPTCSNVYVNIHALCNAHEHITHTAHTAQTTHSTHTANRTPYAHCRRALTPHTQLDNTNNAWHTAWNTFSNDRYDIYMKQSHCKKTCQCFILKGCQKLCLQPRHLAAALVMFSDVSPDDRFN